MRIVLLGAPGSGKRTQTKRIVEKYNIPAICTGELLKNAVTQGGDLGLQVKAALDAGRSVSEEVVLELIHERLLKPDAVTGFVLDGFPRNILQAITLDELLIEIGKPLELALLIDIETDALMERLVGRRTCKSCGAQYNIYSNPTAVERVCDRCGGPLRHRADDNEETISSRLHIYDHLVSPLLKHYAKQHKLKHVDGFGEIDEVFANICRIIDSHEPPAPVAVVEQPVPSAMDASGLQPVPEEDPVKQLIPTGLEPPERQPAVDHVEPEAQKKIPPRARKKVVSKKKVAKKKTKPKAKATSVKKPSAAKKAAVKKKITTKKQGVAVKKSAAKKKAAAKKTAIQGKKKSATKKKAAVKKARVAEKGMARKKTKKKATQKAVTRKKGQVIKKKVAAAAKKRSLKKQSVSRKASPVKKKTVKKKQAKRAVRKT